MHGTHGKVYDREQCDRRATPNTQQALVGCNAPSLSPTDPKHYLVVTAAVDQSIEVMQAKDLQQIEKTSRTDSFASCESTDKVGLMGPLSVTADCRWRLQLFGD